MKDTNELLARAHHYREMAGQVTDQKARDALLELADEYEKQARHRDRQVPHNSDTPRSRGFLG